MTDTEKMSETTDYLDDLLEMYSDEVTEQEEIAEENMSYADELPVSNGESHSYADNEHTEMKSDIYQKTLYEEVVENLAEDISPDAFTSQNSKNEFATKNIAEKAFSTITENEDVDKAIRSAYKKIKKTYKKYKQEPSDTKVKPKKDKYKHGNSQEETPIAAIQNGIIRTKSGMYVKILEIVPVNFWDKSIEEQDDIARTFSLLFDHGPASLHMKCIVDKNNPARLISHIKEACENELAQRGISKKVIECAQDVINKIKSMSENSSLTKRYFISWKYEGKSSNIEDIIDDMYNTKTFIANTFYAAGNAIIENEFDKETLAVGEILYYFFNRKSCREESLIQRISRFNNDVSLYNRTSKKVFEAYDCDYLAPKGLYFHNNEYMYQDGQYKTFIALKSSGHPYWQEPGWLDIFSSFGDGTELDIYTERKNKELLKGYLESYSRRKTVKAKEKGNNPTKQNEIISKVRNINEVINGLNMQQEVYDVYIQLTLSADSIRELRTLRTLVLKELNKQKIYSEPAYANVRSFYYASMPLMELPRNIFNRNKRNYLTSSLEALYMPTGFEMCDYNGFVLGENVRGSIRSTVSIDPFNTSIFMNANMSIFGMTGSGKTYSMEVLARSMRVSGQRIFFILPLKAHEYKRGTNAIDGTYISLYPGSKDRINICEIWPEINIDKDVLKESTEFEDCLLTKKITFLIAWIDINMKREPLSSDELDYVEDELYSLYKDFGITKDNNSIYDEDGSLKPMPYLGDIYDRFMTVKELTRVAKSLRKYVYGTCSNLNGPTNIDLTNKYIVFDVDKKNIPEDLLGSFILIAVECTYSLVKQNRLYKDTIILDETWLLIKNKKAAELIQNMIKIIRGYGASLITATQDVKDYVTSPYGSSIISGSAIKLIMFLEPTECNHIASLLGLSHEDVRRITHFSRGQGMLITSREKILVNIIASEKEDIEFTTDPNKLKLYAQMESGNKKIE